MLEKLDGEGQLKATMLKAHLAWAEERTPDVRDRSVESLDATDREHLDVALLATEWIPF